MLTGNGNNKIYAADADLFDIQITTGNGNDLIRCGNAISIISSGGGKDNIMTKDGRDIIDAGDGDDVIDAKGGNDRITGGFGNDKISGGTGADTFNLRDLRADGTLGGYDLITDFYADEGDKLSLNKAAFKSLNDLSALADANLVSWPDAVAKKPENYMVFDETNKKLYYDPDGNGPIAPMHIATLVGVAHVHAADFDLVP